MKQEIKTEKAQSAKGLLSQAIVANGFVFTSGFIHQNESGEMINGSVEEMFTQVMKNVEEVLKVSGSSLDKVVKVTLYVTDIVFLKEINPLYTTYFSEPFPARETICVKELPLGAKIEMSVVGIV